MDIDLTRLQTADQIAGAALIRARAMAEVELIAWINETTNDITGRVPDDERLSWSTKAEAARAVLGDVASPGQAAMIAAEASVMQVPEADLARRIAAKADAYVATIAILTGLRQVAAARIAAAKSPEDVADAVTAARAAWAKARA